MKVNNIKREIPISNLQDGEVAVVIDFPGQPNAKGAVVQRYSNVLIRLGEGSGKCWPHIFDSFTEHFLVEVLPPGTELII